MGPNTGYGAKYFQLNCVSLQLVIILVDSRYLLFPAFLFFLLCGCFCLLFVGVCCNVFSYLQLCFVIFVCVCLLFSCVLWFAVVLLLCFPFCGEDLHFKATIQKFGILYNIEKMSKFQKLMTSYSF